MNIRLFDYWRSSASYRVRIALNLKGVAWESVPVNLVAGEQFSAANLARNPQGQVPTIDIDGQSLTQSLAIISWLDALYPNPPLLPTDPFERAKAQAHALIIAADTHPIDNMRVLKRLEAQFGADQAAKDDWYRHWVANGLRALEAAVAGTARPYLGGAAPNLVDICLVPQLYNARRFAVPLNDFPTLVSADAAATAHPAFAAAHPDRFAPAA